MKGIPKVLLWGHDHDGAYRQLPTLEPAVAALLLLVPGGVSLWLHNALLFGASGSVWGYGRVADLINSLARIILALLCFHFVDDFTGIEQQQSCASGCDAFQELNRLLGRAH